MGLAMSDSNGAFLDTAQTAKSLVDAINVSSFNGMTSIDSIFVGLDKATGSQYDRWIGKVSADNQVNANDFSILIDDAFSRVLAYDQSNIDNINNAVHLQQLKDMGAITTQAQATDFVAAYVKNYKDYMLAHNYVDSTDAVGQAWYLTASQLYLDGMNEASFKAMINHTDPTVHFISTAALQALGQSFTSSVFDPVMV
jgi:hypothetical protein